MNIEYVGPPVDNEITISAFQAEAALLRAGLLDAVNAYLETADPEVKLRWKRALTFRRYHPDVLAVGVALGMTDEQLDQLFELGKSIVL